jgi:DNA-binding CsgD family transcriptional regulator
MAPMIHEEEQSSDGTLSAGLESPNRFVRRALAWLPAGLCAALVLFASADLTADLLNRVSMTHIAVEVLLVAVAMAGLLFIVKQLRFAEARARDLERDLDGTRADLARWRAEAQDHLRGLGAAIERQFERWELTPAEREVGLLLLKGLSLKEIGELRDTSERTVRQQSLAIYRKADLAGRAELAAFFLEDLFLPSERDRPRKLSGSAS